MSSRRFKNIVLPVLAALAIGFAGITVSMAAKPPAAPPSAPVAAPARPMKADAPPSAPASLTKADVEKIIHDYIVDNPLLILNSVDDYQKKITLSTQNSALEKNQDFLFKDADSPEVGDPAGDVTIVEFMDYNCHYCKLAMPTVMSLLEKDKKLRVIFKDFPILGPTSETAAKWAIAAQKQKKYFEFHKALMGNKIPLSDAVLEKIAKDLGLDVAQAKKDADSTEVAQQISKNQALGSSLGLSGTPAFIVGEEVISGVMPLEDMQKMIAAQRAKKAKK
jgi:protein-disulfide isomerase